MQCSKPDCERPISRRSLCASHYKTWRIRQHAYGRWSSNYVDAGPAREHVAKLRAAGVGTRRINELSGVGRNAIRYLGITRAGRAEPSQRILRTTAERLLAVPIPAAPLELLAPAASSMRPAPSDGSARSSRRGTRSGRSQTVSASVSRPYAT
ncbi:hypothetical protein GS924_06745 [Rhodococcus hoagii]|nr:hypothetical protein [Prescottella equi]